MVEAVVERQEPGRLQDQPVQRVALGDVGAERDHEAAHLRVSRAEAVGIGIAVAVARREFRVAHPERRVVQADRPGDALHVGRFRR